MIPSPNQLFRYRELLKLQQDDLLREHFGEIALAVQVLLDEVDRLRRIYEATNPCPSCRTLNLVRKQVF